MRDKAILAFSKAVLMSCAAFILSASLGGCRGSSHTVQGYIEGEYVYVASPLAGELASLPVARGDQVVPGQELFSLEDIPEKAAHEEAARRLAQAKADLEDLRKGKRPSEIQALAAQLEQARAAADLAAIELARLDKLADTPGAVSEQQHDSVRSARDQSAQTVAQLEAELITAQLGARTDRIAAAEANVRAWEAALTRAEWNLSQKRQTSVQAGQVTDTLYRIGEWVPAGRPVLVMLPPDNIKLRTFVPETLIGTVHIGDEVLVSVDGVRDRYAAKVSFISPQAEFTPPVIYSRESRSKLVFMIEAVFAPESAVKLHPGQPVDVSFGE
jgi:HlyD family secretion protein